ncbi:MAG: tryptophan--tRNA ligase [Acidobacteriaceae bacterium]
MALTTDFAPTSNLSRSTTAARRVLSGMRPTGKLHLGNYVGALKNWARLQYETNEDGSRKYECYFFIADYHALTTDYADPRNVAQNTLEVMLDWLGAGLDPEICTLFVQSHVPQHAELHLLLSMITPLGWLERVPTYKEQQENLTGKDLSTYGFLGYPLLQAADILIYQADFVPVGQDQVAHVELTREVARRFNQFCPPPGYVPPTHAQLKETLVAGNAKQELSSGISPILPEPQVLLTPSPKLPGTDGRKMSKSYGNTILLTDAEPVIRQKLKPMVTDPARVRRTDPGDPDKCPVGDLHKVFSTAETMAKVYEGCRTAGIGCIECKGWAADSIVRELTPIQQRRARYNENSAQEILRDGAARARARASQTMAEVNRAMHLLPEVSP